MQEGSSVKYSSWSKHGDEETAYKWNMTVLPEDM